VTDLGTQGSTRELPGSDDERRGASPPRRSSSVWPLIAKLLFLGVINALAIASLPVMLREEFWPGIITVVLATIAIDWAYLSRRAIPAKYLIPGTIFAIVFLVYPVLFSGFTSFTNFATANRLTFEQALDQFESGSSNVPGTTRYELVILGADGGDGELAFLLTDDQGTVSLGTAEGLQPLTPDQIVTDAEGEVVEVEGFVPLTIRQIGDRQQEILDEFEVPAEDGAIKAVTVTSAAVFGRLYTYDPDTGTLTENETGTVYRQEEGNFTSEDGNTLQPGWRTTVGFANFTRIFTSEAIRGPFIQVFVWNFVFAVLSVVTTFAMGLGLAVALNHPGMRGRRTYRSLLILPYALPSFMTALIWAGMLNQDFGVINQVLGANVPWLRDPTLAKISILIVNLWLGFPYMFLISTGALQSIPEELKEASYVDGANPRQSFRAVTFPLLLISLAPLLIASFAFNFNNFNIIYLLNGGGPPIAGAQTPAGHTDILISYTYRLAFESGQGNLFGFASAIAVIIFFIVAIISVVSFRQTRAFEEIA
jgi:arabinogalactan oligomer / maltooligosaccharide transport system permease protein